MIRSSVLILLAGLLTAAGAPPASELELMNAIREYYGQPAQTQAEFDAARAVSAKREVEYEQQRLRGAGFVPARQIAQQKRTQIRATFSEPRLFLRMPGITIERGRDSRFHLTLTSDGRAKTGQSVISKKRWKALVKLENAAFAPDPPPARSTWRKGDPLPVDLPVCHGWGVTLERIAPTRAESAWGWECNRSDQSKARLAYEVELAKISLTVFPQCSGIKNSTSDPLAALGTCFGKFEPSTTGNP